MSPQATPQWIRYAFTLVIAAVVLYILSSIPGIVQVTVIAALLAYILAPFASYLESRGMSRTLATTVVFVCTSLFLGIIAVLFLPPTLQQLGRLQTGQIVEQAERMLFELQQNLEARYDLFSSLNVDLIGEVKNRLWGFFERSIANMPGLMSIITNLVLIPFMLFFFIKDSRTFRKQLIDMVPNRYFEFSLNVIQKMDTQLGNYLRGQFFVALVVGSLSTLVLWLLHVDFFLVIGPLAGLANLIPYVGPVFGSLLAIAASIITTGTVNTVPWIIISFSLIQLIDNVLLQPLILARNVRLHPLTIMLAILIGGQFFNLVGLILAVPVTAIIKVIIQETLINLRRYRFS